MNRSVRSPSARSVPRSFRHRSAIAWRKRSSSRISVLSESLMAAQESRISRAWIARGFTVVEDVVYIGIGLLLAASAMALLINGFVTFVQGMHDASPINSVIALLDNMLLVLLVVEL